MHDVHILKKPELRYGHLCGFLRLVILSPIDFLFGFPFNLIVNSGQNKFEVDILKKCGQNSQLKA